MGCVYSLENRINSVSFLIDDLYKISIADGYQTPWYVEWQLEGAKNLLYKLEVERVNKLQSRNSYMHSSSICDVFTDCLGRLGFALGDRGASSSIGAAAAIN